MLRVSILIVLVISMIFCNAQKQDDTVCFVEKFSSLKDLDEDAIFPVGTGTIAPASKGGIRAWIDFLSENVSFDKIIKSLADTVTNYLDSVIMKFIVSENGKISDLEILYAGNNAIKEESIRLLKLSCSNWESAYASSGRSINAWHIEKFAFMVQRSPGSLFKRIGVKK